MKKHETGPSFSRRGVLLGFLAMGAVSTLQGCFPIVAGGAAVGASVVADRRTSGAYVEDEAIEWKVRARIRERFGDGVHVGVTSFNRIVLLTGEAPNAAFRKEVGELASKVDNVRGYVNEVVVAGNASLASRSNDAMITSNVKARFLDSPAFSANNVKVVTEAGTTFLMGIVTRPEADAATEVARTSKGVAKVVRVFEYVSEEEAKRLDRVNSQRQSEETGTGN